MNAKFEELKGKTITKIEGMGKDSIYIEFFCSEGTKYVMDHNQDCCESVYVEDVCGDVGVLFNRFIQTHSGFTLEPTLEYGI